MAYIKGTINADNTKKLKGTADSDTIEGLEGNDSILGGAGGDYLDGGRDNDNIKGEDGDDTLIGGDGYDILNGGAGNDSLDGGAFDDTLQGGTGNDTLLGGSGNDSLDGGAGNDRLDGGTGTLEGIDSESADTLIGGDGDDIYVVDSKGDVVKEISGTLKGGNDTIESYITYTLPTKNVENLTLIGEDEIDGTGNDGKNLITGNDTVNKLDGKGGDDTINAGGGDDTLIGGAGHDVLNGEDGNDELHGDAGNDTLNGGAGDDNIDGGVGDDVVTLNFAQENYEFSKNDDGSIDVKYTDSAGEAGDGEDTLTNIEFVQFAGVAKVKIQDVLNGVVPNNSSNTGNAGNTNPPPANHNPVANSDSYKDLDSTKALIKPVSELVANDSDSDKDSIVLTDVSNALGGKVSLDATKTNFTFSPDANVQTGSFQYSISDNHGGTATGTVNLTFKASVIASNSNFPVDTRNYDLTLPLSDDANTLDGSPANEKFLGLGGNDVLNGKAGNDYLDGGTGNDTLYGDAGDDYLLGGDGADTINGNSGNDSISGGDGNDSISGNEGNDFIDGGGGDDSITDYDGSDTINGGDGNDKITTYDGVSIDGGSGNDDIVDSYASSSSVASTVHGGTGDDYIHGSCSGNKDHWSSIYGDAGNDKIDIDGDYVNALGGEGNDTITSHWNVYGEAGKDILSGRDENFGTLFVGGADADRITTFGGADTIYYGNITDSGVGAGNRDIITDFDTSSGDVFRLWDLAQNTNTPLYYLGMSAFDGKSGEVRFNVDAVKNQTIIQIDMNGDKAPDMEIELTGIKILSADDFVLVKPV